MEIFFHAYDKDRMSPSDNDTILSNQVMFHVMTRQKKYLS